MYCKHCGREIGDGQRFCSYCGARQQENGPDQVPPQPDGTTATQTGNYRYDAPPPSGSAPTGGNALLTIFAIVCAVVYGVRAIGRFFGAVGVLLGAVRFPYWALRRRGATAPWRKTSTCSSA